MEQNIKIVTGKVADVFAHRFVVEAGSTRILADLGFKGAERIALAAGDEVEITGEQKSSELKGSRIVRQGSEPVDIVHGPKKGEHGKDDQHGDPFDPAPAIRAVTARGFTVVGEPDRNPKHFEITGHDAAGNTTEFHVAFDGVIRKSTSLGTTTA